jgi:hypothetical protein
MFALGRPARTTRLYRKLAMIGSQPVLGTLFPNIDPDQVRQTMRACRRLTDNGDPGRLLGLAGSARLADPRRLVHDHQGGVRLHLTHAPGRYRADVIVSGKEGAAFFDDGTSVNLDNFGAAVPAVGRYLDGLSQELGIPRQFCHCAAFVSPPGSGLPLHFDDKEVLVVQLYGHKRWLVADNASVRFPTKNHAAHNRYLSRELSLYYQPGSCAEDPPTSPAVIDMVPGHVLLLPRGHWHGTEAGHESASISLSFAFTVPTWSTVFLDRLREALLTADHWRAPAIRLGHDDGQFLPDEMRAAMDKAITALVSGELDRALAEEVRTAWAVGPGGQ